MPMVTKGFINESLSGPQREFFPQSHFVFLSVELLQSTVPGDYCILVLKIHKKIQLTTRTKKSFFLTMSFRISVAASTNLDFFGGHFLTTTIPGHPWRPIIPGSPLPRKRAIELDPLGHDASPMVKGAGRWRERKLVLSLGVSKNKGIPKMDGENHGKTLSKWMIWGYPYFWKHPVGEVEFCLLMVILSRRHMYLYKRKALEIPNLESPFFLGSGHAKLGSVHPARLTWFT